MIVDYNNPNIIYAESQNGGLGKSTNGGASWNYSVLIGVDDGEPTNWSTPVAMDPNTSNIFILWYTFALQNYQWCCKLDKNKSAINRLGYMEEDLEQLQQLQLHQQTQMLFMLEQMMPTFG